MAVATDPGFMWVDVGAKGEVKAESDPLKRGVIPAERLATVRAAELAPDHSRANVGVSAVIREDEPPESLQLLLDFLRLPPRTQSTLSKVAVHARPRVFVLSNSHRLSSLYPVETVAPLLRAILATGVTVIMTFADAPNAGRLAFDVVLHVEGWDLASWRETVVRIEKGPTAGPLTAGTETRLGELSPVAKVLAERLG